MPSAKVDRLRRMGRTSEGEGALTMEMERTSSCEEESVELSSDRSFGPSRSGAPDPPARAPDSEEDIAQGRQIAGERDRCGQSEDG